MGITNARARVTGASSGLGARIAAMLAAEGTTVAIGYPSGADRAQYICNRIPDDGGAIEGTGMSGAAPDAYVQSWRDKAVSGRTTSIDDVARHAIAFCASSTVTGQVLVVDGGIHFR